MTESLIAVTPKLSVPRSRFLEWYQGMRPLPGQDATFFFQTSVEQGLLSSDDAAELRRRHEHLTRQEEALSSGALVCKTCAGAPPPGFACTTCGTGMPTA